MSLKAFGARLRNRFVKVASVLYDAGNTSTIRLPQGTLFQTLWVRLAASLNITGALTFLSDAPGGLISKLEVVGDGRTIWSADTRDLYELARFHTGKAQEIVTTAGTGSTQPQSIAFPVYWEAVRRSNPADSLFWSQPYAVLELKITWAAAASAIYSAGTATINSTTKVDISLEDTFEGHGQVSLVKTINYVERTVTAAQTDFEIPLSKNGLLDSLLIRADVDGVFVDTLINSVRFQFDSSFEPIKSINWADLQNKGISDRDADGGASGTGRVAGIAFVDLIDNGMISSAPNLRSMSDPKLILDVALPSGTTRKIRVTQVAYDLAPTAAAA